MPAERIYPEEPFSEPDARAPMFRKEFRIAKKVRRARAYVAGVELYEFSINGKKVGDEVLAPPAATFANG